MLFVPNVFFIETRIDNFNTEIKYKITLHRIVSNFVTINFSLLSSDTINYNK